MQHFKSSHFSIFVGVSVIAVTHLWAVPAGAQSKEPFSAAAPSSSTASSGQSTAEARERDEWRKALLATPKPKNGCFTADFPERSWREIPCKPSTPKKLFLPPRKPATQLNTVGGSGPDFSATVTGHISSAEGSFDSVSGVTSTNAYTLQLNTAPFSTSTCSGGGSRCTGWEQYVYESSGSGFIQYWLLEYGPAGTMCPAPRHSNCAVNSSYSDGWCPFQFSSTGSVYCVVNAQNEAPAPAKPMTSLGQLRLTGAAGNGTSSDSITVTENGTPYTATGGNYFPDLGSQWQEAEFNVFGDGGGSQATFNSGSNLTVRTEVLSGTRDGPGCHLKSWTGESTNLTLVNSPPSSPASGSAPALVFAQVNPAPSGTVASCADAASIGDTHLTTFGGLLYDFQASGDFVLLETGPDFLVHTRQVSGAPTWPNAAVNNAIAVKTPKDRIAICLPNKIFVDGKPVIIRDGARRLLAGGGSITRSGNTYVVLGPSGDSLRTTLNSSNIDVSAGLGRWPNDKLRGLLANANGDSTAVVSRDGKVLRSPFDFESLYGYYTTSWRVPPRESILSACGEIKSGIPRKPFFAGDLDPTLARRNEAICKKAGVEPGPLMDACIIDVAVVGPQAAKALAGRPKPVAVGDAH